MGLRDNSHTPNGTTSFDLEQDSPEVERAQRIQRSAARPSRKCPDAVNGRSVSCYLVSFCTTLYLAGIQTEMSVLTGVPQAIPTQVDSAEKPLQTPSVISSGVTTTEVQEVSVQTTDAPATESDSETTLAPSEIGYMLPRSGTCPKSVQQVTTLEECIKAAEYLKKTMMSRMPFHAHTDPPGCIYRKDDRDIFFNSRETTDKDTAKADRKPVCKGAVNSFGVSPTNLKPVAAWDQAWFLHQQTSSKWTFWIFPMQSALKPTNYFQYFLCHFQLNLSPQAPDDVREEAAKIRLFCFAWTPFRPGDEAVLAEVTKQYSKCDGHAFFSDRYPQGEEREDVIVVKVPEQRVPRSDGMWLYHRNMVGLMPTWDHMLRKKLLEDYDWVINSELDHFLSPSRARLTIVSYLRTLRKGMSNEQNSIHGPLMLMWGNAFVFNKRMIGMMREQWKFLGVTESGKSIGVGCPQFMRGRQEWPEHCSQDIVYPSLVAGIMRGGVNAYGRPGCGQADATTRNNIRFQLGCWEMQHNPYGMSEEGTLAKRWPWRSDANDAVKRYAETDQADNHKLWYSAKNVPVIHHIVSAEVHRVARELLDPEPEKGKDECVKAKEALKLMRTSLDALSVPLAVTSSLNSLAQELEESLRRLYDCLNQSAVEEDVALRPLRTLLLAVQNAMKAFASDPSMSMKAAKQTETGEDEDALAVPQLGVGRESRLKSLLEILPLGQIQEALMSHLNQLPASPALSPLAPFVKQTLQLSQAILLGAVEAMLATSQISLEILRLVCFMMEKGLNAKEEEKEGDGEGGQTEFAAGTGMGQGEGLRDVTDEIEDDAQLEGTRNEKEEEQPEPEQKKPEEDNAREVGFDLDTEAKALPQNEEDKQQEQDKEEEEEQDLDRQQGKVDLSKGGTLDEKLWNGDEDDKDEEDGDADNEKEKGPQEDIEAHGAQGEGEAETTAKDEEESKSKKDKDPKNKANEAEKDDVPEQEPQEPDKTDFEDKDAQFDVQMQPQGPGDADGEGEGEGQGEGEGEGEEGDADSDFIKSDIEMEGDGEDNQDQGSEEGSKCEEDVGDLDAAEPGVPQEKMPEEGPEQTQEGVEPSVQGEEKQPDDPQEDKNNAEQKPDVDPSKAHSKEEKPPEPLKQGDPGAPSLGKDTTAPQQRQQEQDVFGGSTGEAANFESQAQQDAQDASAGDERGGSTATATDSRGDTAEMPSAKPQKSAADKKQAPSKPSTAEGESGEERRLQKLDILRETDGADKATGDQKEAGAEQGLHMADPKSGLEALGECQDSASVDQKAMGITEQDGEEKEENDAMAVDEEEQGKQEQKLPNMHLQEMKEGQLPDDQGKISQANTQETEDERMQLEGARGGMNVSNASTVLGDQVQVPMEVDGDLEGEDEGSGRKRSEHEAMQLWGELERSTSPLAAALCEQLRTILEPTLKGRLQGYFRTGKRISMRRVIPFIASNYRRDKIWLRRTKPSKREYQIVVAIDNSRSMKECNVGPIALQTLCVLCQALAQLEVGEYAVLAFGSATPRVLLPLGSGQPHANSFNWTQAGPILREFTFEEESVQSHDRSLADMMRLSSQLFDERSGPSPARPFSQMSIIISDGRFNKNKVRPWVHAALARQQLPLLIIVDAEFEGAQASAAGATAKRSVFELRAVTYESGRCQVVPYLQDFPFPYYVVVQDLQSLPAILSDVLKQWFELATSA
eukprot:s923_g16.t5